MIRLTLCILDQIHRSHYFLLKIIQLYHYSLLSSPDIAGAGGAVGAKLLLARILAPYFQKMTGIGTSIRATQPSSVPAQLTPRPLNM